MQESPLHLVNHLAAKPFEEAVVDENPLRRPLFLVVTINLQRGCNLAHLIACEVSCPDGDQVQAIRRNKEPNEGDRNSRHRPKLLIFFGHTSKDRLATGKFVRAFGWNFRQQLERSKAMSALHSKNSIPTPCRD